MKQIYTLGFLFLIVISSPCQLLQNDPIHLNPSFVGEKIDPTLNVTIHSVSQFSPLSITYDQYVKKIHGGVGLRFTHGNKHYLSTLLYAHKIKVKNGVVISPSLGLRYASLPNPNNSSQSHFSMDAGLLLTHPKYYIGIAHQDGFHWGDNTTNIHAGYGYEYNSTTFFDINMSLKYHKNLKYIVRDDDFNMIQFSQWNSFTIIPRINLNGFKAGIGLYTSQFQVKSIHYDKKIKHHYYSKMTYRHTYKSLHHNYSPLIEVGYEKDHIGCTFVGRYDKRYIHPFIAQFSFRYTFSNKKVYR